LDEVAIGVAPSLAGTVMIVPAIEKPIPDTIVHVPVDTGNAPYACGYQAAALDGAAALARRYTVVGALVWAAIQYIPGASVGPDGICKVFQPITAVASPV